jgi:hypothetical protein
MHPKLGLSPPERTLRVCRLASRFCVFRDWAPLAEVPLPNGRRADLLALLPDGRFAIIEVKSCERDFLSDLKWRAYREFCDLFYFAIDADFPRMILPEEVGLVVVPEDGAPDLVREATEHPMAAPRRRALLLRYARLGATRLAAASDPTGAAELRAALRSE